MSRILPFGILPGHWGLKGLTREIAKAEYELDGYALEEKLITLRYHDDPKRRKEEQLKLDHRWKNITDQEFETAMAKLKLEGSELALALLDIEKKFDGMSDNEYNKRKATINDEPFITIINCEYDKEDEVNGFAFEFDWNTQWIDMLKRNGYEGFNEEQIIQKWFEDVCRGVVIEGLEANGVPFGV